MKAKYIDISYFIYRDWLTSKKRADNFYELATAYDLGFPGYDRLPWHYVEIPKFICFWAKLAEEGE